MLTPSKMTLVGVAALLAAVAPLANAHGYMSNPKATFAINGDPTQFCATMDGPTTLTAPAGQRFNTDPASNTKAFNEALKASEYKSIKALIDAKATFISGASKECGVTSATGAKQPLPAEFVNWAHSDSEGFTPSHQGPCEIWCDDKMAFTDENCAANFPTAPAKLPYDKTKCEGASMLKIYWLALHSSTWQAYINCAPLEGGSGSGASTAVTPAASSKTPTVTKTPVPATGGDDDEYATPAPAAGGSDDDEYTTPAPATGGDADEDCDDELPIAGDADEDCDDELPIAGGDDAGSVGSDADPTAPSDAPVATTKPSSGGSGKTPKPTKGAKTPKPAKGSKTPKPAATTQAPATGSDDEYATPAPAAGGDDEYATPAPAAGGDDEYATPAPAAGGDDADNGASEDCDDELPIAGDADGSEDCDDELPIAGDADGSEDCDDELDVAGSSDAAKTSDLDFSSITDADKSEIGTVDAY